VRVGFVGLGIMGSRMVARLLAAGQVPLVHDLVPAAVAAAAAAGAEAAGSLSALVERSDVLLSSLPMPADVESILDDVAGHARPGLVWADLSTIDPATARRIDARLAPGRIHFLDAPVSGGQSGAAAGTLAVMVGGDAAALERARPLLDAFAARVFHVGPVGAGSVVKLANQLMVGANTIAAMEAVAFARSAGVAPQTLLDIVSASTGDSFMFRRSVRDFVLTGDYTAQFSLRLLLKDLRLYAQQAGALGTSTPAGDPTLALYERAAALGLAPKDFAAIVELIERRS
jgi:2-hydroxymethylglutarate dehydrogenase